ncbi:Similar to SMOX: Spermine oxidase (Homo sapiens) [Cotesia congregata]|uniref:Similar to SMOX: Spermine oxidase (Homo sapiens) n=1 Tax=Cotesia congregata TaxID=51543 RepID=A0A8J2EJS0_COTCN|nr:Similar to SMOX: Spermine oxidase (Homo sapiens) [Cotesia congregata]
MPKLILFLFVITTTINNIVLAEPVHDTRVIIVGSGAAGIAAASKLLQNGFNDVKIIEAENRIGGRLWAVKIGQWVHGEEDNVSFELAWPLGLLEHFNYSHVFTTRFFNSSGEQLLPEVLSDVTYFYFNLTENSDVNDIAKAESYGDFIIEKMEEYFKRLPEVTDDMKKSILYLFNLVQGSSDGSDDWTKLSPKMPRDYPKKYPNPAEELPVLNNTILNSKVVKINYDSSDTPVEITTEEGKKYLADHIIVTPSLGVLKADYEKLFNPPLPDKKINAIQNLEMGHVAKIYLYYEDPWWHDEIFVKFILWSDEERKQMEADPAKRWLLGYYTAVEVEHKPKVLCLWMTGPYVTEMEQVSEEEFNNKTLHFVNQFFGKSYNLTQPSIIKRSMWNTNDNFRGTYSYRSITSDLKNAQNKDLAEPIMKNDKPVVLFAGEATDEHFSTVHGAIHSGWREADRLIKLYKI